MDRDIRAGVLLILLITMAAFTAAQTGGLSISQDTITVSLGERITSSLLLTNPKDEADTYSVKADTIMNNGNAALTIDTGDQEGDVVTADVAGGETRTFTLNVQGSSCLATTCTGSVTFIATSQTTDERYTVQTDIVIRRNTRIHGSPGLTLPYLVLLAALGTITILIRG